MIIMGSYTTAILGVKRLAICCKLILFATCFSLQAQVQTISLKPGPLAGKDADIRTDQQNLPNPNSPDFIANAWTASGNSFVQRSLIWFDLSCLPTGATIVSAYLNLYSNPTTGHAQHHSSLTGSNTSLLKKVTQPWDEAFVCWNNQPTTSTVNQVNLPQSTAQMQNYLNINVTALITDQWTNPLGNFGFMFQLVTESTFRCMSFSSSDNADSLLWPELIINFECIESIPFFESADTICVGSSLTFNNNSLNATHYYWSFGDGSNSTVTNPSHTYYSPGIHIVTLSAATECDTTTITDSVVVLPYAQPELGPDTILCPGQSITISPGNSFDAYQWSTNGTSPSILVDTTGLFWVEVFDSSTCSNKDSIYITVLHEPEISLGNDTIVCIGLTVQLNPGFGFNSFLWSTGDQSPSISVSQTGEYSVTVTYNGYCYGRDTIFVDFQPGDMISIGPDSTTCYGATINLTPGLGYAMYVWNTGAISPVITVSQSGTYMVSVTRIDGCYDADTVDLTFIQKYLGFLGNDTTFCGNNGIVLDAGAGFTDYLWQNGSISQFLQAFNSGLYSVVLHDTQGCIGTDSIVLQINNEYLVPVAVEICDGDSVLAGGGFQFQSGQYYDSLSSINGCDSVILTDVVVNPVFLMEHYNELCMGDSIYAGGEFQNTTGIYTDSLNTISGCDSVIETHLTVYSLPVIYLPSDSSACADTSIYLDPGSGNYTYLWNTNDTTQVLQVEQSGIYSVVVTDTNGCTNTDTCEYVAVPLPHITIFPGNTSICVDSSLFVACHGANQYVWSPFLGMQFINDSMAFFWPEEGLNIIYVVGTDDFGCVSDTQILINAVPPPISLLEETVSLCDGLPALLDPGHACDSCTYNWFNGSTEQTFQASESGLYWVILSNGGCRIRDTIEVKDCFEIFIPNVFTPNGDGANESFRPDAMTIMYFTMFIYNRWGDLIIKTNDSELGWDGTCNGSDCPDGVYYYVISYSKDGSPQNIGEVKGSVTLLR